MNLNAADLRDLQLAIADRLFLQVSGWHLYLGDAQLAELLAIECCARLGQGALTAAKESIEAVQVPLGDGSTLLPLAQLIPCSQLRDLQDILKPYCR